MCHATEWNSAVCKVAESLWVPWWHWCYRSDGYYALDTRWQNYNNCFQGLTFVHLYCPFHLEVSMNILYFLVFSSLHLTWYIYLWLVHLNSYREILYFFKWTWNIYWSYLRLFVYYVKYDFSNCCKYTHHLWTSL